MLQVALGVLIKEKKLIQHLYEYGVCVSYDEVRRFNTSAAASDDSMTKLNGKNGLIQGISDNFDANLVTQNGLKQTHSLATIATQFQKRKEDQQSRNPIKRIKKKEVSSVKIQDIELKTYHGQKKPPMPDQFAKNEVPPLKMLCNLVVLRIKAINEEFWFIQSAINDDNTPDFNVFCTKQV